MTDEELTVMELVLRESKAFDRAGGSDFYSIPQLELNCEGLVVEIVITKTD